MTQQRGAGERPVIRRDADGEQRAAPNWETLTERLIREAQEAGAFDELPRQGRPLVLDDDRYAGDMAVANRVLRNAGAAPPWIETDKEIRGHLAAIERLLGQALLAPASGHSRLERELERLANAHDDAVARLEGLAPTPRQHRACLDRTRLRGRLETALNQGRSTT